MPSVHNVRHVRLVYRWRKSAEPGLSIHLIHCPSIPDHLTDVLRSSQRHAAELTLWSAKLVSQMSQRKNSAEGSLTHMSALRRSNAAELTSGVPSLYRRCLRGRVLQKEASLTCLPSEGSLTHMSALRSLPNHLILITATPRI